MGLMEMMKYNITALTTGEKLLGSVYTMILGMVTCMVALTILIICIKLMSVFFNGKNNDIKPSAPSAAPKSTSGGGPSVSAISIDDECELVAVITAAITALRGNSNFTVKNISEKKSHPTLSNWVTTGRYEAFNSRKVTKK